MFSTATVNAAVGSTATVKPSDAEHMRSVLATLVGGEPDRVDDPDWVAGAREAWNHLPVSVRSVLRRFRRHSGSHGTLVLKGLPVDESTVGATPMVKRSAQLTTTLPAALLMSIAAGLGDPFAFLPEKSGHLVQDVVPVPGMEKSQGNTGSVDLTFHTENAFHEHRPDFVLLLCLRSDHNRVAGLRTACSRKVLPLLTADTHEALFSPEFHTAPPPSFQLSDGDQYPPHTVFTGEPADPDLRVDLSATKPLTERAAKALKELSHLFDQTAENAVLQPGEMAIVDNRVTVHGRTTFTPRYDGRDRWLQRAFVATDLRRSRDWRPHDGYVLAV